MMILISENLADQVLDGDLLFPGSMCTSGMQHEMKVLLQYNLEVNENILYVRSGLNTGHPTKLLRYFSGEVRNRVVTCRPPGNRLLPGCRKSSRSLLATATSEIGQKTTFLIFALWLLM